MKEMKDLLKGVKKNFLNRWFTTGMLIALIIVILVILYIVGCQPLAFIYSAF